MKAAQETHNRIVEERDTLAARVQELAAVAATLEANHEAKQAEAVAAAVAAVDSRCKELETALAKVRPSRVSKLFRPLLTAAYDRYRQRMRNCLPNPSRRSTRPARTSHRSDTSISFATSRPKTRIKNRECRIFWRRTMP
jgi:hypothetical protein